MSLWTAAPLGTAAPLLPRESSGLHSLLEPEQHEPVRFTRPSLASAA